MMRLDHDQLFETLLIRVQSRESSVEDRDVVDKFQKIADNLGPTNCASAARDLLAKAGAIIFYRQTVVIDLLTIAFRPLVMLDPIDTNAVAEWIKNDIRLIQPHSVIRYSDEARNVLRNLPSTHLESAYREAERRVLLEE